VSDTAIVFDRVWKKFRLGERHDSLRDLFPSLLRGTFRGGSDDLQREEFWALKDVSFEVARGEALGIIGPNGAGKSTTLKLLTKILKPTRGRFAVRGRVGALIEVAAGFHPDLTGRENIFLQGAVLGMKRAEIARQLDEIIDFAGVNAFVDTPVKRYSSGMNARLGFAIAAHLHPNVLIIDEVLSVGDMTFQQRCIERMSSFKRQGVAIVFVSHDLGAVVNLCARSVVLKGGHVIFTGNAAEATQHYLKLNFDTDAASAGLSRFSRVSLTDLNGKPVAACQPGRRLRLSATIQFGQEVSDVTFGFVVHQAATGIYAYGANSASLGVPPVKGSDGDTLHVQFEFVANLTRGLYLVELHAATAATMSIHARCYPAAVLEIGETVTPRGVADLAARCEILERVTG